MTGASTLSVSTSSGRAMTTGPGRPDVATAKARVTISGMRAGVVDLHRPFGDAAEEALVVHLLPCLALPDAARHLADEQDDRRGILHGDVDAGRGIGGAGAARHQADAGLAGELAVAVGHHRRAAFLAADDRPDRRIVQRVEHGQIAFARHAIEALDAVRLQRLDDQLSARLHSLGFSPVRQGFLRVCSPSRGEGRS